MSTSGAIDTPMTTTSMGQVLAHHAQAVGLDGGLRAFRRGTAADLAVAFGDDVAETALHHRQQDMSLGRYTGGAALYDLLGLRTMWRHHAAECDAVLSCSGA